MSTSLARSLAPLPVRCVAVACALCTLTYPSPHCFWGSEMQESGTGASHQPHNTVIAARRYVRDGRTEDDGNDRWHDLWQ